MNKIFLSHSSVDKPYVSYIAETLGQDRCVYDAMCFEAGMNTLEEIFSGIDQSSLFVLFISNDSLNSEWVQREIKYAEEKLHHDASRLSQIFPIIIDSSITHKDPRIPDFLKSGFGSYNLRYIESNKIACRKILAQQRRLLFDADMQYKRSQKTFYGRNDEITSFQRVFDVSDGITCLVASGIEGIGRKSYLIECLRNTQVIEEYYEPAVISMNQMDSIEDVLMKLSEIGFGKHTIESLSAFSSMDQKIEALIDSLKKIQQYNDHVIIYDNGCIVGYDGELVYWFDRAIHALRREVTISIAARNRVHPRYIRKHPYVFAQELFVLPLDERMGLMRQYATLQDVRLSNEDRMYFRDIFTGYPPQIIFCVDAIKDYSLDYVKSHSYEIVDKFSQKASNLLKAAIPQDKVNAANGLLAFMSSYGVVPSILLDDILALNSDYMTLYRAFRSLTICRAIGSVQEYVEVNPVIGDYVQRNRFTLPDDIKKYLKQGLDSFEKKINDPSALEDEDFESVKYYLKRNVIEGKEVPEKCLYSTIYLAAIYELYNTQRYAQVINIVRKLKENRVFTMYDEHVQSRIQSYYCRALAREGDSGFYAEVEFFRNTESILFNFLMGFMERNRGNYSKALERYQKVLADSPRHRSARREIVIVYRGLEEHSSAYDYAQENYREDPENPYQIQPYFEILVKKSALNRTEEELRDLDEMRRTLRYINEHKPLPSYYELEAQFAAFVERDWNRAKGLLQEGRRRFPDSSYIEKAFFDCAELFRDKDVMEECLNKLKQMREDTVSIRLVCDMREVRLDALNRKSYDFVKNKINGIRGMNEESKLHLLDRIKTTYYT